MKKIIKTEKAPLPIGPYNQAVLAGKTLYISGQIPMDPATKKLTGNTAAEQAGKVMENLEAVLDAAGLNFSHVVKTSIFLTDMNDFQEVNEVYGKYFDTANAPARETVQVAGLPLGVKVEISMIAVCE